MIDVIQLEKGKSHPKLEAITTRNMIDNEEIIKSVNEIIREVRQKGDSAVLKYTVKYDYKDMVLSEIKVGKAEINNAYNSLDKELLRIITDAAANIRQFHEKQKENSWFSTEKEGVILGQIYRPLEIAGIYVPGGTAPLISSVLMNIIPARVAGVEKIVMCTPPQKDGKISPAVLAAAKIAGADDIYRIGGAQAIASMAFGTQTVPRVDKICGPGNIYVATAKRLVYGYCDIDMIAGPSEIVVLADESADPRYTAADLLSQAEHDTMAAVVLITTEKRFAELVNIEIKRQYDYLDRKGIMNKSLLDYGAIFVVSDLKQGVELVNRLAPEHLELCVKEPFSLLGDIKNAGAVFLGSYSPEPLGDYFAGPNHVLPTGGTARFFSPLNVGDFIKKSSIISYTRNALAGIKNDIIRFALEEGLDAHANSVSIRFDNNQEGNTSLE